MSKTNKRERVTFWAVPYAILGATQIGMAYFDDKSRADVFHGFTAYSSAPVSRWCSNPETIAWYRDAICRTEAENGAHIDWLMGKEDTE